MPCSTRETELQQVVEEGRRAAVRLQMQNEIAQLLAVEDSPGVVMPAVLETMCGALGWHWGGFWEVEPSGGTLALTSCWHQPSPHYDDFVQLTRECHFLEDECLPGQAWARGSVWEPHFGESPFLRAQVAHAAGLNSAFAFPVALGAQTLAVIELFSEGVAQPDPDLLSTLKAASHGIARHLERWRSRQNLAASERRYRLIFEVNPLPLMIVDQKTNRFLAANAEAVRVYGISQDDLLRMRPEDLLAPGECLPRIHSSAAERGFETSRHRRSNGDLIDVEVSAYVLPWEGHAAWMLLVNDVSARKRMERERVSMEIQLRSAQRLESIGNLAAGIAHEINTPTQYVGDNARFVAESITQINEMMGHYERLAEAVRPVAEFAPLVAAVDRAQEEIDWDYLRLEAPKAMSEMLAGIEQVARIVKSMKEFSHPGQHGKVLVDLNHAVENTVTVSRNEWKYVAELSLELDPAMPPIPCLGGQLNQVLLNLIVNAAHAIADQNEKCGRQRGQIVVRTLAFPNSVEIQVEDDGGGIPEQIRDRVFDPFFTTKEVGLGTGQGLAIARSVVVDRHGGSLCFDTVDGVGTTFHVQLPLQDKALVGDLMNLSATSPEEIR